MAEDTGVIYSQFVDVNRKERLEVVKPIICAF
jgi:hypothetical protein